MRIIFYDAAGRWTGGMRTFARAARGLVERGHRVAFVCPADSELERQLTYESFETIALPRMGGAASAWRLRRELTNRFAEVVFVGSMQDHVVAAFGARLAGRAAVLRRMAHGERLTGTAPLALRLTATGYVYPTEEELRQARRTSGARLRSMVVPLGIDPEDYAEVRPAPPIVLGGADSGTRHLVCLYSAGARVAAAGVLRVMALLVPRHPELRLTILGGGIEDDDLRMHTAALRISGRVTFLGERSDRLEIMRAAEFGWVAAQGDAGAWGMLDCAAMGLPVLAERSTLARHYVADGITGLLLPGAQPADAAGMIARLLASTEERRAMGTAARARVNREFPESEMVVRFEQAALAAADRTRW